MNSGLQIYNEQNTWHSAESELRIQSQARHVIYTTGIYAYNTTQKSSGKVLIAPCRQYDRLLPSFSGFISTLRPPGYEGIYSEF